MFSKAQIALLSFQLFMIFKTAITVSGSFEGPEKLLEVWFAPSAEEVPNAIGTRSAITSEAGLHGPRLTGLRAVHRETWETMLDLIRCKVLSVMKGEEVDAFLLSESSMFVWPHKIIIKTCGTTGLLLGLKTLLHIARSQCGFSGPGRWFYSRKAFMFPGQQLPPHTAWEDETKFLDQAFGSDDAKSLTLGTNPWYLYHGTLAPQYPSAGFTHPNKVSQVIQAGKAWRLAQRDSTLEILMTGLSHKAASRFDGSDASEDRHALGKKLALTHRIDASSLLGGGQSQTDAFLFSPCGFSANMIGGPDNKRYGTIHVTPESSHSFASFETDVDYTDRPEDLRKVISRILTTFEPEEASITFLTSHSQDHPTHDNSHSDLPQGLNQLVEKDFKLNQQVLKLDHYNLRYISLKRQGPLTPTLSS